MILEPQAQNGVLSDPTPYAEYLVFNIKNTPSSEQLQTALANIINAEKSIGQKDTTAKLEVTTGFSAAGWKKLFAEHDMPKELHDFPAMQDGPRHFVSSPGDIFFMIKSKRMDLNYQVAKYLNLAFRDFAELEHDIQAYQYLDDRDLIDFVDGTENPKSTERAKAVLVDDDLKYLGGSYLTFQRYVGRTDDWDALTAEEQEGVVGRTKWDDIEIPDEQKKPFAHNVKTKVFDDKGEELKMYRQNRAYGNAKSHGTMFVGFASSAAMLETSLKQMIIADEDGYYDKMLDFFDNDLSINFFVPPKSFMEKVSG